MNDTAPVPDAAAKPPGTREFTVSEEKLGTPLASGFIAGEALVAGVIPLLIAIGLLSPR